MKKTAPLRLIAFHDSINDTLALQSLLRNEGIQAQARHAEDLPSLHNLIREEIPELILHLSELDDPSLKDLMHSLAEARLDIPVISMSHAYSADLLEKSIQLGAEDLINLESKNHIVHVIRRSANCQQAHIQLKGFNEQLQEADRRCRSLMESSRDAIAYIHAGMHVYANSVYLEQLGFERFEDMEGSPLLDHVAPKDQERVKALMRHLPEPGQVIKLEDVEFLDRDGKALSANIELSPATIDGEPCTQLIIRQRDDRQELEEQINYLSQHDILTGLYNRQYFLQKLEDALAAAKQDNSQSIVIHIQITNIQEIKNKLGVAGMDKLITDAGKLLEKLVGTETLLSRYSAHAFALLLSNHQLKDAEATARKMIEGLTQNIFEIGDQSATVRAAAGLSVLDIDTPSVNELLNRAERATLDAESKPPHFVAVYTPKEGELSQAEQDEFWSRKLRDALRTNRLKLLYQPMVSLNGQDSRKHFETFLRLIDENGQDVSPREFLAAAERTGLSQSLDRWVILNALQTIIQARRQGQNLQLFVHLSSNTLKDEGFPDWLSERLVAMQIHDGSLGLQIHERVAVDYLKQAKELVRKMALLNCPILIDGFGLGDDPFRILNYLDAQWLRLDRSLLENFVNQKANQDKVRELIKSNRERGKHPLIVANVEDAFSLQMILSDGADYAQGHFIQPPAETINFELASI